MEFTLEEKERGKVVAQALSQKAYNFYINNDLCLYAKGANIYIRGEFEADEVPFYWVEHLFCTLSEFD